MSAAELGLPLTGAHRVVLRARVAVPRGVVSGLVALAGVAAAAAALASALTSDHVSAPGVHGALMAWVTLVNVSAGLIAWRRRPGSRFGPLMIAAGFCAFLSSLSSSGLAVAFTIGIAFDLLAAVVFLHMFLAFPAGRLPGRPERMLVGAGYVVASSLQLTSMALGGFGPDNVLAVAAEPEAATAVLRVELLALSLLALAGVGVLVGRRRDAGRPLRRPLALLVRAFSLALVMLAFLYASAALGLVSGQPVFEAIRRIALLSLGAAPLAFLAGLLDARLSRADVGAMFVALRDKPAPAELRAALARALRDPSLELAFWLPELESWADVDGRPLRLPDGSGARAATLVDRDGRAVAALVHDAALREEPELLEAAAAAAAIALENVQLNVELLARLEELKGSRARIVEAGDTERQRLERNLHDGAQQRLVAVALQLRLLQKRIHQDAGEAERIAQAVGEEVARSLAELRELARGLHPAVLEHGLAAALDGLAGRSDIPATVTYDARRRLPQQVELAAYFVACEALANVAKYAQAGTAAIRVRHGAASWRSRSPTTGSAAPTAAGARACAAWPIASRRSAAACASSARPAWGPPWPPLPGVIPRAAACVTTRRRRARARRAGRTRRRCRGRA